jgi:hypothetical protein
MRRTLAVVLGVAAWLPLSCFLDTSGLTGKAAAPADGGLAADGGTGDDSGKAAPCPSIAFFCEDFESGGVLRWETYLTPGDPVSLSVYTADAGRSPAPFRGSFALDARAGVNSTEAGFKTESALIRRALPSARAAGVVAIRSYFYAAKPTGPSTSIFGLEVRGGGGGTSSFISLELDRGVFTTVTYNSQEHGVFHSSGTMPPWGEWVCLEWDVTLGSQGSQSVFVNGGLALAATDTTVADPSRDAYDHVALGLPTASGRQDDEAFFDDVALAVVDGPADGGAPRIGCE